MENELKRYTPSEWMAARPERTHLGHYVTYYDSVLPSDLCEEIKTEFDLRTDLQRERAQGGHFRFKQLDITFNSKQEPFARFHREAVQATVGVFKRYRDDIYYDESPRFPVRMGFENFRVNKTMNNGRDGFGNHIDVGDYASARRFLTILYYLETNEEGGDAGFPMLGFSVKPIQGACLIFPSTWQWLHCGLKPLSNPKWIMTTFAHYM